MKERETLFSSLFILPFLFSHPILIPLPTTFLAHTPIRAHHCTHTHTHTHSLSLSYTHTHSLSLSLSVSHSLSISIYLSLYPLFYSFFFSSLILSSLHSQSSVLFLHYSTALSRPSLSPLRNFHYIFISYYFSFDSSTFLSASFLTFSPLFHILYILSHTTLLHIFFLSTFHFSFYLMFLLSLHRIQQC